MGNKYLLVKGVNGFGNMISTLNVAYQYAVKSNRTLTIDWTHPEWRLGFDRYFSLNNVKYIPYDDFLQKCVSKKLCIYPPEFSDLSKSTLDVFPDIEKTGNYSIFNKTSELLFDKNYDVLVFSYNWLGYNDIGMFWSNLVLNSVLKEYIQNKLNILGKYKGIHIRHTDNKNVTTNWAIDFVKNNLNTNIYVATDNQKILNIIQKMHNNVYNFTRFYSVEQKPLHTLSVNDIDKHNINIDTITDMYMLINSDELKITPIKTIPFMTTYSLLAMSLKLANQN